MPGPASQPLDNKPAPLRLVSLDVFRGATMIFLSLQILHLAAGANRFPDSTFWRLLSGQMNHAAWTGMTAWDLIQPAFMFMVGVALPWSVANRRARGQDEGGLWWHTLWRSFALIGLGIFLRSLAGPATQFTFIDVLAQIGLGYPLLFLLANREPRIQWIAFAAILLLYWLLFALYPLPANTSQLITGLNHEAGQFSGFAAHWNKNAHPGVLFDQWFLNLFPRTTPFEFDPGGYTTLNFIPSIATMMMGVFCGDRLRTLESQGQALRWLLSAGLLAITIGVVLHLTGVCPIVKRLWTPSWVLVSGGAVILLLALVFWVVDMCQQAKWLELFRIVGLNSLAMYVLIHIWDQFLVDQLMIHLGWNALSVFGDQAALFIARVGAVALLCWFCVWLHQKRVYLRL